MDEELRYLCNKVLNGEELENPVREYTGKDLLLDYYADMDKDIRLKLERYVGFRVDAMSDPRNVQLVPICKYCGYDLDPNAWECPGCGAI